MSERPVASITSSARVIAGAVARHQAARGRRVALAELGIERRDAFGLEPRPHGRADVGRDRRDGGEALRQRLEIEPGAADQDRQAPCPLDLASAAPASAHQRPTE